MKFTELGLSKPLLQAITELNYDTPSPIQAKAIPPVLAGSDVMAAAQTGTGKTAAFTLPLLQKLSQDSNGKRRHNQARALILTPTRELAAQILESARNYGKHLSLKSEVVFGGVKINPQMQKLRSGVDILVATPGRLLDLHSQNAIRFDDLEVLVLDEADRMLDMGFIHDIKRIIKLLPTQRQNLLFSATFSNDIRNLAKNIVNNPVEVSVTPPNSTADSVQQWIHPVDKAQKSALLVHLVKSKDWQQVLVFSRTKHGANKLTKILNAQGVNAAAIHGNKSQGARTRALAEFKSGEVRVLVATDIAARGIDIDQLPQVVNFDLPSVPEDYIHRIGRTGRAGADGKAYSLVSMDEAKELRQIERLLNRHLDRDVIMDFEPSGEVPVTQLGKGQKKPKKPKDPNKPKAHHRNQSNAQQTAGQDNNQPNNRQRRRRRPNANSNQKRPAQAYNHEANGNR